MNPMGYSHYDSSGELPRIDRCFWPAELARRESPVLLCSSVDSGRKIAEGDSHELMVPNNVNSH